jgi:hypothetical protein
MMLEMTARLKNIAFVLARDANHDATLPSQL